MIEMIEQISIDLSNYCSKQCPFCYNHSRPDSAQAVFEQVYPITDHRVQIDGETYPIYLLSERKRYAAEIEHYAQQPYRGEVQALVDNSFCVNDPSRR